MKDEAEGKGNEPATPVLIHPSSFILQESLMTTQSPDRPAGFVSRRQALKSMASGFGYLAFASLAHEAAAREAARTPGGALAAGAPHFPARAKRVIFLCMNGGPSHVDTFDYKPELNKRSGEATPVGRDRG